ncbi:hypothetical protein NEOLEDRAFT_11467 [Neolentinus lepideus HHB14362 ss-1]|uniref:Pentatricopeptide repeat-containing protein-mitochondrial domain-containing protein n=1 Tax=Neolentinus lepideus HHB14362 ss-1 TaxID=1314782 RepID=A0A165W0C6_9AGAM|nr:hypothetical protein NEOLEDRAFT_11467 [Neolentinus lepideus HHB14362 ss-1]
MHRRAVLLETLAEVHLYWRNSTGSPSFHLVLDFFSRYAKSRTFLLSSQWRAAAALKTATVQSSPTHTEVRVEVPQLKVRRGHSVSAEEVRKGMKVVQGMQVLPEATQIPLVDILVLIDTLSSPAISKAYALDYLKHLQTEETSRESVECILHWRHTEHVAQYLAASRSPERALKLLRLVHKIGYELRHRTYEVVVHRLAEGRHWDLVVHAVNLARVHVGRSSARLLNWCTLALSEQGHYTLLDGMLEKFKRDALKSNRRTYHILITAYIRNRDLEKAKFCLQEMEQAGFPVDASTYAAVISVYRSLGPDPVVQKQAIDALPAVEAHVATRILNSIMQFAIDARDINRVVQVMSMFDGESSKSQNIVTAGLDQAFFIGASDHQIPGLPNSLSPNASTIARLMSFMSKQRDLPTVLQIFYQMQAAGIVPDTNVVAALVRAHINVGDEATAVRIVADMCPPTVPRSLLTRVGLVSDEHHFGQALLPQSLLTVHVLNALLKGVIQSYRLRGFGCILRIMRIVGVKPDGHTTKIFIHYLESNEGLRSRDVIRILRKLSAITPSPTLKHLHKILKMALQRDKYIIRGTGGIRNYMAKGGAMISATDATTDPTAGLRFIRTRALISPLIKALTSRGVRNDAAMYALRIRHDGIKGDMASASKVLDDMVSRGIYPNEYHYSALMAGYAMAGNLPAARAVMGDAAASGVAPNVVLYTILLSGYTRLGQTRLALRTFNEMIEAGITPDFPAVDTVVRAFLTKHRYDVAKKMLLNLWTLVAPFPEEGWHSPLESLIEEFRSLAAVGRNRKRKALPKGAGRMVRWKLKKLLRLWRLAAARASPRGDLSSQS